MRRGHGSTKVPGVKLRPAAPTKYIKAGESCRQITRHHSIIDDVDSTDILKSCKKPFAGIVVCGSGLTDKINLFQQVVQLGAQTSSDLTDRVTHLICENPGSAKYNYCVEHGIPILEPSWITDAYDKWISGESVDIRRSATVHRFPTFKSVKLCLTGISDVDRRKQIRKQFEKNGGIFVEALDKDTELTHLLCGPDRGDSEEQKGLTSKMQFVIKVNKSRTQKVHLVWEDWFWDCIEFKGILDEKQYLATGPRPPRKIRREPSPLLAPIASSAEPIRRKSSTISPLDSNADMEETANIKRMPDAAAVLWENALRKRGFEMRDGKLMRSPSKSRISNFLPMDDSEPSPSPSSQRREESMSLTRSKSSLSAAFKRSKSFAAKPTEPEGKTSAFQRIRSTPATAFKQSTPATALSGALTKEGTQVPEGERNLFTGFRFRALGEANGPKLTEALELRGGSVVTDTDDEADFIIVRLVGGSTFYRNEANESEREKFRTECWIEQCMFEERICGGDEHPAFVPLRLSAPIPGAEVLVVHISGLNPSEKTPSTRLLKAIGATVTDQLSRRNTHLICPCGSGPKFNKAQEWKIPILTLQWLFDTVSSGQLQDVAKYLVASASSAIPTTSSEATRMMTDITNSDSVQGSSKNKNSVKVSDKSQSSTSPAFSASTHVEIDPMLSESWTASDLLSDTVPEHPPTSSPSGQSCRSPDTAPTTPSPLRKHATVPVGEVGKSRKPSVSPFTSPIKSKMMDRVPSSATPSPLRIPSMPSRNSHSTSSEEAEKLTTSIPPTVTTAPALTSTSTLSGESANVLKDAIASLLGKRPSSDDASSSAPGTATGARTDVDSQENGQQPPPRATKRSKPPPRTKSRQGQGLVRDGSSDLASARSFSRSTSLEVLSMGKNTLTSTSSYTFDFTANSPTESLSASLFDFNKPMTEVGEESMRVTYEDPSQRAEERRLLSLISGNGFGGADTMAIDGTENNSKAVDGGLCEEKPQPQPRKRGRNLVRRVTGAAVEQN